MNSSDYVAPKVFISYSWTSDDYADWVKNLAERLLSDGVDVVLDRWDLKAGQDKFVFMEQMVTNPEIGKVLLMCDQRYAERADNREGGVGTETTIISQEVYDQAAQEKFLPIITERSPNGDAFLPTFIKSRIHIDISDARVFERGYEDLLRALTGRPATEKPPLGKPPSYLFETAKPTLPTTFVLRALEDALLNDKRHSTGLAHDYLDRLLEALTTLQINCDIVKDDEERQSLVLLRLEESKVLRDEWVSFLQLISRYGTDPRLFEALLVFFDSALELTGGHRYKQWNQHLSFIVHEIFLYTITLFLQNRNFDEIASILGAQYRDPDRAELSQRFGIFTHSDTRYLESILNNQWSKQENGTGYKYPQQAWLQQRADDPIISFSLLKEADVVLWLRYQLERDPNTLVDMLSWFPVTIHNFDDYHWRVQNFLIFQRAASKKFFDKFRVVLGVESKADFMEKWNRAFPMESARSWDGLENYWKRVLNVEALATT